MMNSFHVPTHMININAYGYSKKGKTILEDIKENNLKPCTSPNIGGYMVIVLFCGPIY